MDNQKYLIKDPHLLLSLIHGCKIKNIETPNQARAIKKLILKSKLKKMIASTKSMINTKITFKMRFK